MTKSFCDRCGNESKFIHNRKIAARISSPDTKQVYVHTEDAEFCPTCFRELEKAESDFFTTLARMRISFYKEFMKGDGYEFGFSFVEVGQTVYVLRVPTHSKPHYTEEVVERFRIEYTAAGATCKFSNRYFEASAEDIGKSVFLTKEAAEQALKDYEEENK